MKEGFHDRIDHAVSVDGGEEAKRWREPRREGGKALAESPAHLRRPIGAGRPSRDGERGKAPRPAAGGRPACAPAGLAETPAQVEDRARRVPEPPRPHGGTSSDAAPQATRASRVIALLLGALATVAAIGTSAHVLLGKRDPRAAFGWIAVCLFFPFAGPVLYLLFGVNRIPTRARKLESGRVARFDVDEARDRAESVARAPLADLDTRFQGIARVSEALTRRPLLAGNRIVPLFNGEQAYPAMLAAIEEARESVLLQSYLFQSDATGRAFVDALSRARRRSVDVRVIVDGVGEYYAWPHVSTLLAARDLRHTRFLPPRLLPPAIYVNLRNHRKVLVVDHRVAFTGGMNIGDRYLIERPRGYRVSDLHFRLEGPVVAQLEHVFLEDWAFCTGDTSVPRAPAESLPRKSGNGICRSIVDGPNEERDRLTTTILGAVGAARTRIVVVTPYFLPPETMQSALSTAALRGVRVEVLLPSYTCPPVVGWAARHGLDALLAHGVRVYEQPPPFDHTKLLLVDDYYVLIGSSNLDPRSLKLNFELCVEIFDRHLNEALQGTMDRRIERAGPLDLDTLRKRPLPVRLRDALCWLFSPYL